VEGRKERRKLCERKKDHVGNVYTRHIKNTTHKQKEQVENTL
jgi:hypothetical protein